MLAKDHAKLTNKDIADALHISKRTVEVHRSSILAKMLAQTRAKLVELFKCCNTQSLV
jgi:FixJ family two-component response regulator